MNNLWATTAAGSGRGQNYTASQIDQLLNPTDIAGNRVYGTKGQVGNINFAHQAGQQASFSYAPVATHDASKTMRPISKADYDAFSAARPGMVQVGNLRQGPGAEVGNYIGDPSKITYDPEWGYIAPLSAGFGYADTKNRAGNMMQIMGPLSVLGAGIAGNMIAAGAGAAGAGGGGAAAGATAFPYVDAAAGISGTSLMGGGAGAGAAGAGLTAIPAAGIPGVGSGALGGIIPTSTMGLGTGGVVGSGVGMGTLASGAGAALTGAQMLGGSGGGSGGGGSNWGGGSSDMGGLITSLLGGGAGLVGGQELARQLGHIAERNAELSNSLKQPERLPYQGKLAELVSPGGQANFYANDPGMVALQQIANQLDPKTAKDLMDAYSRRLNELQTPQGAKSFMDTDPGVLGMLDQAKNKFNANASKMGTGGTVFTDYLRNISDITGSQYNTRIGQLGQLQGQYANQFTTQTGQMADIMNSKNKLFNDRVNTFGDLGGFGFPANAGNYGQIAAMGADANAGSYAGIGNILGSRNNVNSILGLANSGVGILKDIFA